MKLIVAKRKNALRQKTSRQLVFAEGEIQTDGSKQCA
jgi:hypothetical protein